MKNSKKKLFIFTTGCYLENSVIDLDNKIKIHFKDMCEDSMNTLLDFNTKHYNEPITKFNDCVIKFIDNISERIGGFNNPGIYTNDHKRFCNNQSGSFLLSQVIQFCHDFYKINDFYISICVFERCEETTKYKVFIPFNMKNNKSVHKYLQKMTKKRKRYLKKKTNNKSRKEKKNTFS